MRTGYCPNCRTVKNLVVADYKREKTTEDGDIINIKTITFHCEACNIFIDSKDVLTDGVRRAKSDRRKKSDADDEKAAYGGTERRSGKERRIWVDRMREIVTKISVNKDTK